MLSDKCGIFGVFGHRDAARLTYLGLYALQHRGQESAGIVVSDGKKACVHKGMGLVNDVFSEDIIKPLKGNLAIGHVRYSTTGISDIKNAQPFVIERRGVKIAIGHNGDLVNARELRDDLESRGAIFQTTMDSEAIMHLVANSGKRDFKDALVEALLRVKGAYSLVLMTGDMVVAARDPHGWRPLALGKVDDAHVIASETCAFDLIGAKYIRDIEPGEIVFINKKGLESVKPFTAVRHSFCIFEYIYFARPDSKVFGHNVHLVRKELGRQLAKEAPVDADIVIPIPDSGNSAALGFAEASGIPFDMGIVRNHYVGRTFIQPSQQVRNFGVKVKLNPVREVLEGKKVAVIEDSIVRGTTSKIRVSTLREAGAREVHMRVSCPPHKFPCYYGIDFPTRRELVAATKSVEKIRKFIGLDSLAYLSLDSMLKTMPFAAKEFCVACFTGDYSVKPGKRMGKR